MTWSIKPYSLASSADMKRSRSMSFSIDSTVLPVCLAYSSLSLRRRNRISRAWISMSDAVPCVPPEGWCIMIRAWGSAERFPLRPAVSRNEPIEAAIPMQIVFTGARRDGIVKQQLGDDDVGDIVGDGRAEEHDAVHQEAAEDVVGAFATARALDDVRGIDVAVALRHACSTVDCDRR